VSVPPVAPGKLPLKALAFGLFVAVWVAYAPALKAPFLFDDAIIGDDATIERLWPPSIPLHPPPQTPVGGRPVVNYSLAINDGINRALGIDQRPDPDGPYKTVSYRVLNVLLHLACGALLFGLLRRTLRAQRFDEAWAAWADPIALAVTGVWLLHPIQSEAVDYVIQRTEIIVSLCYLGTLYGSVRAWDAGSAARRTVWYAVAALSCLLGMGSKEVMISAPLMIILYDRAFRWPSWRAVIDGGRLWFYAILAATTGWLIWLMVSGPRSETVGFHLGLSWYAYLYSQAWAILHYIRLVFWPNDLNLDYGLNPIRGPAGIPGLIVLSAFGVATIIAWTRVDRWGWFAFLGAWFFAILAPSSSVVPINTEIAAERRVYLALVSVLVLTGVAAYAIARRLTGGAAASPRPRRLPRPLPRVPATGRRWLPAAALALALACLLTTLTFNRSRLYANGLAMWRDVLAKAPDNPRAYENLASMLGAEQPPRLDEAERVLREGIAADSTYHPVWDKLAAMEISQHRLLDAEPLLKRAIAINPNYARSLRRLGNLLVSLQHPDSAIPYLERAAAREPSAQLDVDLATADLDAHRPDDAIRALQSALELTPNRTDILQMLGALLTQGGRPADAVPYLEALVGLEPRSGLDLALLSVAYAAAGRVDPAVNAARSAATLAAGDERVYLFAGRAMLRAGRPTEAAEYFSRAVALAPTDSEARELLAAAGAHVKAGKGPEL